MRPVLFPTGYYVCCIRLIAFIGMVNLEITTFCHVLPMLILRPSQFEPRIYIFVMLQTIPRLIVRKVAYSIWWRLYNNSNHWHDFCRIKIAEKVTNHDADIINLVGLFLMMAIHPEFDHSLVRQRICHLQHGLDRDYKQYLHNQVCAIREFFIDE